MNRLVYFSFVISIKYAISTIDLNIREVQMVADHLSEDECRKLSEALHMINFGLDHELTGNSEPRLPCIQLILHWDSHEGKGKTFHDLALRLWEIGRKDLANKLSRAVYHEKSEAVKKMFLEDPFKKNIHKNSHLLVDAPVYTPTLTTFFPSKNHRPWSEGEIIAAIVGSAGFIFHLFVLCVYWPKEWKCRNKCYRIFKEDFYQHMMGIRKPLTKQKKRMLGIKQDDVLLA